MPHVYVYNVLNKLKWSGRLADCKVVIRHRGAPGDEKLILGKNITETAKTYFLCKEEGREMETHIPMHRILSIELEGTVLWKKRGR